MAPLNTDDNQRVTFMAPRLSYQRNAKPYQSLLAILAASERANTTVQHLALGEELFVKRLGKYWNARNVYLHGLVYDAENRPAEAITAYIESARLSPDFTSGYAQCLSIAS